MPHISNVGRVRPQPFFVCATCLNHVTTGNGTGTKNVFKGTIALGFLFSIFTVLLL